MTKLRQRMIEDMQVRNLALNTQKSYLLQIAAFAKFANQSPDKLGPEDIRTYRLHLINMPLQQNLWVISGSDKSPMV